MVHNDREGLAKARLLEVLLLAAVVVVAVVAVVIVVLLQLHLNQGFLSI